MSAYLITELVDSEERVCDVYYVKLGTKHWVSYDGLEGLNPLADIEQALNTLRRVTRDVKNTVLVLTKESATRIKEFMENSGYFTINPHSVSGLYTTHRGSVVVELPVECKWSDYAKAHYPGLSNIFRIIR